MQLHKALALLASLSLAGCAGNAILLPATTKILDDMPKVDNSTQAPCWMQKQVAAQNSYIATVKNDGKEVVYGAPCVVDKPKPTPPKTS
jgi:hypothetical protein